MSEAKRVRIGDGDSDGVELAWFEAGRGERPFVLVHGFTGSSDDFADVMPALARRGRTVTPDQRGHGGSTNTGRREGYTLEQLARDLAAFLDALGIERCDLLGHSMGGMVAMRLAAAAPERIASLVLMDTAPHPISLGRLDIVEAGARMGREHGMGVVFQAMKSGAAADPNRPEASHRCEARLGSERYWARIQAKIEAMDPEAMGALGRALGEHEPFTDALRGIACPALVMVGEQDTPFLKPSELMARTLPDAQLVVIPDAAHSPQLENEAAWLEAILAHLDRARA